MNYSLRQLKRLMEDLEELEREAEDMVDSWNSDDECARAENDPGLQYAKNEEIILKREEIRELCEMIGKGDLDD